MAIRYDKKLNSEIRKTVNNFNAKIKRIEKYIDNYNYLLPEKMTVKALKENVYTRNELRRKLKELQRYSTRGIEETMQTAGGYSISKYEYTNLMKEKSRVKGNITRSIKRLETTKPKVFGKVQSMTFAQMGESKYLNLLAKRKALETRIDFLSKEEFKQYQTMVYKTGRNMEYMSSLFRDNYITMLNDLAYFTKYSNETMQISEQKYLDILNKRKSEDILKELNFKEVEKDGVKTYEVNKIKYLEYALSQIKDDNKFYKFFEDEKAIKSITDYYVLATGKVKNFNPENIKDDVKSLYDNLINNIDDLIAPYL